MIGQFTFSRGAAFVTAALDDRGEWVCDDRRTRIILRGAFPFTPEDESPARGGVKGGSLLARASAFFEAGEPYYFQRPLPPMENQTD